MNNHTLSILSGKYQILKMLGQGTFGTVYLVRHHTLETERAIKVIPKTTSYHLSFLSEAHLLKSIHHPGIPIIYDLEEDDKNYYLVEEYIQGESIEEFLLHQKIISRTLFFTYCEQLCDIFNYLHTRLSHPILYQDLKPEHIIVCGNQLKLIDFGASSYVTSSGNNFIRYGNVEFSAPESFSDAPLTIAADIYSIGKMMQYLSQYVDTPLSHTLQTIIQKTLMPNPKLRYETVEELALAIKTEYSKIRQTHLLSSIAVIGNFSGCGSTHFSFFLVSVLNYLGYNAYYYEKNNTDALRKMHTCLHGMWEREGCFYYRFFRGFPKYGHGIHLPYPPKALSVGDFGNQPDSPELDDADLIILLCSDMPWRRQDVIDWDEFLYTNKDRLKIICNCSTHIAAHNLAKQLNIPVYHYFYDKNPFRITRKKIAFAKQFFNRKGRFWLFSILKTFQRKNRRQLESVE